MYAQEYIDYLIEFHATRDYFECHEILEEYWKETGAKDKILVAFIQLAVGMYHYRRGNVNGAKKILSSSKRYFQLERDKTVEFGVHGEKIMDLIDETLGRIKKNQSYISFYIPLDEKLDRLCRSVAKKKGLVWKKESDLKNEYLVNKHILRKKKND